MEQECGGRGDTASEPAVSRRALLASVAGAAALAGCSGGDDGGSDDDGGGSDDGSSDDGNGSSDDGPSIESMCNVSDEVDGLSVIGCQSETTSEALVVTVTLENDGDQQANLFDYQLQSRIYDSETIAVENLITPSVTQTYSGTQLQPGDTTTVTFEISPQGDATVEDIVQYQIELGCGSGGGAYCEGS